MKRKLTVAGFAITFFGSVLFSTKAIIVKRTFADIRTDALSLLMIRMICALPFYLLALYLTGRLQKNEVLTKQQWIQVILLGMFGYYISSFLDFEGLKYISAGLERLILFLYPTFVVLINRVYFRQKISGIQKIALLLTYSGIAIAYYAEWGAGISGPDFIFGSLMVLLCAATYSIYIVGSGNLIPKIGASRFTAYSMLAATAGVSVHFIIMNHWQVLRHTNVNIWGYGLLLAIIATVIPSFLLSNGMKRIGSNNAAIVSSIGPVSTILQAHFFLGEKIYTGQIIGTILVIAGVLFIGWKSREVVT